MKKSTFIEDVNDLQSACRCLIWVLIDPLKPLVDALNRLLMRDKEECLWIDMPPLSERVIIVDFERMGIAPFPNYDDLESILINPELPPKQAE